MLKALKKIFGKGDAAPQAVDPAASVKTPEPAPAAPVQTVAGTSPTPATSTPPIPAAVAGAEPIPLYRLEVPVYSVVIPAAQLLILQALGTFHERQGEQSLLTETGTIPAGWGRVYGSDLQKSWSGTASPSFDGSQQGFQIGHDLYASQTSGGLMQRFGFFVGQSHLQGDVDGFAEGFQHRRSGRVKLDSDQVGGYWTLIDPTGWYLDAVAMWSRLDGDNRSDRGVKMDTEGQAVTLSVEAGYPIPVAQDWVVEPQVQVINQRIDLDKQNDGISEVKFDSQDYWTGRLGARPETNSPECPPTVRRRHSGGHDARLDGACCVAGEEGFEPSNGGIKIRCLNQLGDSPALNLQEIPALLLP